MDIAIKSSEALVGIFIFMLLYLFFWHFFTAKLDGNLKQQLVDDKKEIRIIIQQAKNGVKQILNIVLRK